MLHPSYVELMNAINENAENDDEIITSRYSIVIAAAKRARQLIENADSEVEDYHSKKPLSVAVEELMTGKVKILPPSEEDLEYEKSSTEDTMFDLADDSDEESEDYSDDEERSDEDDFGDEAADDGDHGYSEPDNDQD